MDKGKAATVLHVVFAVTIVCMFVGVAAKLLGDRGLTILWLIGWNAATGAIAMSGRFHNYGGEPIQAPLRDRRPGLFWTILAVWWLIGAVLGLAFLIRD